MNVTVLGLWHLGTVTAACLASAGHNVVGLDFEQDKVHQLRKGQPPIFEPGLEDMLRHGLLEGRLRFTTDIADAVHGAEVVWAAHDTPVDDDDLADVEFVMERVCRLFPFLVSGTLVLISSQLPVGSTRRLEQAYAAVNPDRTVSFAYSPENLRLGKAIKVFTQPDRVVVGVRTDVDGERVRQLMQPFTERIEWMSVESAEMSKHASNAFLATSISFINEVATLCEQVGADAGEVERALKSDVRIGPGAYLSPGPAFAGGTLARDIVFLRQIGQQYGSPTKLLSAVQLSNEEHKGWVRHRLQSLVGNLRGQRIAVWGLTYKPGTDTLRRSSSVELCRWLTEQGTQVHAHDPAVKVLPDELARCLSLSSSPTAAAKDSVALVIATPWPDYRSIPSDAILAAMNRTLVIDPGRFLADTLGCDSRIQYVTVGKGVI